jgi:hypothetical protein
MEKALTKLSSFTIPRKAKQELTAIGGDISVSAAATSLAISVPSILFSFLFLGDSWGSPWFVLLPDESLVSCSNALPDSHGPVARF